LGKKGVVGKKGVASLILKIILNHEATCLRAGKHRQAKHTLRNSTGRSPSGIRPSTIFRSYPSET